MNKSERLDYMEQAIQAWRQRDRYALGMIVNSIIGNPPGYGNTNLTTEQRRNNRLIEEIARAIGLTAGTILTYGRMIREGVSEENFKKYTENRRWSWLEIAASTGISVTRDPDAFNDFMASDPSLEEIHEYRDMARRSQQDSEDFADDIMEEDDIEYKESSASFTVIQEIPDNRFLLKRDDGMLGIWTPL